MAHDSYEQVAAAIRRLQAPGPMPGLAELAAAAGLSPGHFQRLFARWAGVSPQRFRQLVSRERAREALRANGDLLAASDAAGLSGPGRLHDLVVTCEAMTPAQWRAGGAGVVVRHGFAQTPFGMALAGITDRGICHLAFLDGSRDEALAALRAEWPAADLIEDIGLIQSSLDRAFASGAERPRPLHLYLRGSNFQIRVWRALLAIPSGSLVTYADLARLIEAPRAARAVGAAVGANSVAWLIPCHRVILGSGLFGNYRWGAERKVALIGWEAARHEMEDALDHGR